MSTTAEKLNQLIATKDDIKSAIIEKGQSVSDTDAFASYADKIRAIEGDEPLPTLTNPASAGDIAYPKEAYNDQKQPIIGTLKDNRNTTTEFTYKLALGTTTTGITVTADNTQPTITNKAQIAVPNTTLATHIGVSADKIVEGNTILGIDGTAPSVTFETWTFTMSDGSSIQKQVGVNL